MTAIVAPVPTEVPKPQPFLYHFQTAPVESTPDTDKVTAFPAQILVEEAVIVCGPQGKADTLTVTLAQAVVLHTPTALTK